MQIEHAITAKDATSAVAADGAERPAGQSHKPVGAILAGLSVLRYMATANGPLPLSRITRDLGLNPSTCLNILRTLANENYLIFDPQSKLYSMGLGVLELVSGALAQGGDMRAVRAVTDLIANTEGVTVTLWRRVQRDRIMLVLESLPAGMSIKMNVGQRLPLLVGAAGRLMGAFSALDEEELSEQYRAIRLGDRQTFREFMDEVEAARQRGWATDEGRYTVGASSVAVPVLNERGEAIFAFTATMFSAQYSLERAEQLARELGRPASLLTSALPYM
ncbi:MULTISPECIES: IclR family transcriptional regulator [unclassified Sphingobium]|uniref:IclR family transcriptional regulator n=1 Tax=unclassified Sphingobium TaxID=2611147 RepID=UPI0035A6DD3D